MPPKSRIRLACVLSVAALAASCNQSARAAYSTMRMAVELNQPIQVAQAPGRPDDLFIVLRGGDILIMDKATGQVNPTPFLSIPGVNLLGEGALVSIAFHPDYASNGRFYTNHTTDPVNPGFMLTTHVREYTVADPVNAPDAADPTPTRTLFMIDQPQPAHNGGWMGFSPNEAGANLYIMSGDGGGSNDASPGHTPGIGNAQDITDNLLGKVLRINVDGDDFPADDARNYAIPADNPFVGVEGDDEIWAYGVRNAFRGSFDPLTGDLYFGDVGQGTREEINFQPAASTGGENYGWRLREGSIANPNPSVGGPLPPDAVDPIYDYAHGSGEFDGNSVTGGLLYRGHIPELQGKYIFADFISNNIWSFDPADPAGTVERINDDLMPNSGQYSAIVSFHQDTVGNLYILDISGQLFRVGITGDLNGDGFVGIEDLNTVLNHWNEGVSPTDRTGDLNDDGFVGIEDLNIVLGNWNSNVTPGDLAAGDATGDGFIGIEDLNIVLGNWNIGLTPSTLITGDIDGDGFVGINDLNTVLTSWNAGAPPQTVSNIPEPGGVLIALSGLVYLTAARSVRRT